MGMQPRSADAITEMVETLEEDILLGRLFPRERLVEDQLSERFNQKRHVVRQALKDLEVMGLIVREAGKVRSSGNIPHKKLIACTRCARSSRRKPRI